MSWSMSSSLFILLALVAYEPSVTSLKHKNLVCDQLNQCVCQFPTGQGVNLTNLASETISFNDTEHGLTFYFRPCADATAPCSEHSSICVQDKDNITTDLGGLNYPVIFNSQGIDNPIFMVYDIGEVKTEILLKCSKENVTSLGINNESDRSEPADEVKYHLLVQSPEACLKTIDYSRSNVVSDGLSNGALFFVVLLILWGAYILVGAAVNHCIRGASGWEMVPHYEFWRTLPSSFMDGMKFVANGCRSPPTYEQI